MTFTIMPITSRFPFFTRTSVKTQVDVGLLPEFSIQEKMIGEVERDTSSFQKPEDGDQHPFDFHQLEQVYRKCALVNGIVDKYVDFVTGGGFYVTSEDERAVQIIETFFRDVNFDTILRAWAKEALIKGSAFMEIGMDGDKGVSGLKVLNADNMYVKRNELGEVLGYVQIIKQRGLKNKKIPFETQNIAFVAINITGDEVYGLGIIQPCLTSINSLLGNEMHLQMILDRKAGSPYHIKVGSLDPNMPYIPTQADISNFKAKLEYLTTKHEWVTGPYVDIKPIEFGAIGDKFDSILRHHKEMLFAGFQVPEVLLGTGNLPEGLAKEQKDAFERRIQSIQAELEKVIEQQVIRKILNANGLDVHVEFEWGQPSRVETNERIVSLVSVMGLSMLSMEARNEVEKELLKTLGLDPEVVLTPEQLRAMEEQQPQPTVPGQNRKEQKQNVFGELHR